MDLPSTAEKHPFWSYAGRLLWFGLAWMVATKLSAFYGFTVWFPIGLYLGVVLISPPSLWPLLASTALAADLIAGNPPYFALHWIRVLSDSAAVFVVAPLTRNLVPRLLDDHLTAVKQSWPRLLLFSIVALPAIDTLVLEALVFASGSPPWSAGWLDNAGACALGIVTVTPVVLALRGMWSARNTLARSALARDGLILVATAVMALPLG